MIRIRAARPSDAAALSAFAESIFRDTFRDSNTAADMDAYCASAFGLEIQTREIIDAHTKTLLVEDDASLIAYAQLHSGSAPASLTAARPIELKRFYVARPHQGSEVAPTLMAAVVNAATDDAFDVVWLGVWEHNARAIAFYRKHGFDVVGDQTFFVGSDRQRDLVMAKPIAAAMS
jgi:diamine N-acetyltransferase